MRNDTLVFALASLPITAEAREQLKRLKARYVIRVITSQDVDCDDLREELKHHGQLDAYFAPVGNTDPDEWRLLLNEFGNGRQTAMTLVMG